MKNIWKEILARVNKTLISHGIGVKHIRDIDNALSLLVRRTYKLETIKEVEEIGTDVELFALAVAQLITEGRKSIGETL